MNNQPKHRLLKMVGMVWPDLKLQDWWKFGSSASAPALENCTRNLTWWVGGWVGAPNRSDLILNCTENNFLQFMKIQKTWHKRSWWARWRLLGGRYGGPPLVGRPNGSDLILNCNSKLMWCTRSIANPTRIIFLDSKQNSECWFWWNSQCWPHQICLLWFQRKFTVLILM